MRNVKFCFILLIFFSNILKAQVHNNPFEANPDPAEAVTYTNPILPGFYSDPSICRAGDDYYLVTSTFEYFPGIPVFHSKDLVNWDQIGYCIDRAEQMPEGVNVFAATIRFKDGVFYVINTNVGKGGNYYVTAKNPEGPWSDPIWIDVPGIDPDLFFDDNGKTYVISSEFRLYEIDLKTGRILTEGHRVWFGTGGRYAEGPHIYKKDGFYYLMAAEGGTEEAHSETIARSNTISGPYAENPANPILAHANAAGQNIPIQGVGHADIIQAADGSWWVVFHGYRKSVGYPVHHILGRETCLAPVCWPKNGWPVINGNGTATINMTCPTLDLKPIEAIPSKIDFNNGVLGFEWNFIQPPKKDHPFYLIENGTLRLKGLAAEIGGQETPAFIGRRLQDMNFTATTSMSFNPENDNEQAGLSLVNNGQHFDLLVKRKGNKRVVCAEMQFGSIRYKSREFGLKPGPVELKITGKGSTFTFMFSQNGEYIPIEEVDSRFLSTETVGWFTGVYVGFYASGKGKECKEYADFDYFEYTVN
ncbi:MAG: glycoside hydrolase family 43 protein [Bacteroidales bacterium]|nr:glycoside hydrolase family 43 protein [Bacteroidales bacterium]